MQQLSGPRFKFLDEICLFDHQTNLFVKLKNGNFLKILNQIRNPFSPLKSLSEKKHQLQVIDKFFQTHYFLNGSSPIFQKRLTVPSEIQ